MKDARFEAGQHIRKKRSPDQGGLIVSRSWDDQVEEWVYRVNFGASIRGVPEGELEVVPQNLDPWADAMAGRFSSSSAFRTTMTYERLRKPPSRVAESFGSARATFYPYQFKPLLKFVESPNQRLLVADDVGLGKTIEAGYILREFKARTAASRILVVVPARLQPKWRNELGRRFDEDFEVVSKRDLTRFGRAMERSRELESFRWIVSYEAARFDDVIEMFEEFRPAIDLVIVDEAHRMRNSETKQYRLGRALSACADAVVFLTATPVQTGLENLFNLLYILSPDEFSSYPLFKEQTEANRPVVRAIQALRRSPLDKVTVLENLLALQASRYTKQLTEGEYFQTILNRVADVDHADRKALVQLQRDISSLSLTDSIISRTRKVEVLPNRPVRKPNTVRFALSEAERTFYDAIEGICRQLRPDLADWGLTMTALMAYRATASCIPAAIEMFNSWIGRRIDELVAEAVAEGDWMESYDRERAEIVKSSGLDQLQRQFHRIGNSRTIDTDSKFTRFLEALRHTWKHDDAAKTSHRKAVVFSFFKGSLRYLSNRLNEAGIRHELISGDVPSEDREVRIERFKEDPEIKVLLSSEVGGEGIDLQFASVVVNYDLPWNPMVVEQRIGRLDRIGQKSKVIHIVNLVTEDTVEDRILMKLFNRIGVFEDTIGEIDPILGRTIEKLAEEALQSRLGEDEVEERVEQAARAFLNQDEEARKLQSDADALMAADQAFLDEIDTMIGQRRVPTPDELFEFVHDHLLRRYPGAEFPEQTLSGVAEISIPTGASSALRDIGYGGDILRAMRKIEGGPFLATFDQDAAMDHARAELIHARHPLVMLAYHDRKRAGLQGRSFTLGLGDWPSGLNDTAIAFSIWIFEMQGVRPRTEIVPLFVGLDSMIVIDGEKAMSLYMRLLEKAADPVSDVDVDAGLLEKAQNAIYKAQRSVRAELQTREVDLDRVRRLRLRTTQRNTLVAKAQAAGKRLEDLQRKGAKPFALNMAAIRKQRADKALASFDSRVSEDEGFHLEDEEIAVGIITRERELVGNQRLVPEELPF